MDNINKIYKSIQLKGFKSLNSFLLSANTGNYEIVAMTEADGYYTVIYKDFKRS